MKICDIYKILNEKIPVSTQEKWDNSGFLIGDENKDISKIVFTLDITKSSIDFAVSQNANLIISHHPVIFDGIKSVKSDSVVYKLISNDISAICLHTPLDIASSGMNEILYAKLADKLKLNNGYKILEPTQADGTGFGFVAELTEPIDAAETAEIVAEALDETDVRLYDSRQKTSVVAVCSGSGGSMLEYAKKCGADTFITGDIKQDRWIAAENIGMNLIDAGHFGTEKYFYDPLTTLLSGYAECILYENKPYKTILNKKVR